MPISTLSATMRSPTVTASSHATKLQQLQQQHEKLHHQLQQHLHQSYKQPALRHQVRTAYPSSPALSLSFRHQQPLYPYQRRVPVQATSNIELVQHLRASGVVRSDAVAAAMCATDRAAYLPSLGLPHATSYADSPSLIGYNQTMSAPHMHAHALELCQDAIQNVAQPRVLDIGAGSGYLTTCFGRLVEAQRGRVIGVEIVPGLAQFARKAIQSAAPDLADAGVVSVHCANGWDGLATDAPFHFIHVGAAVSEPPQALLSQLADGGRLVVPLDQERGGQVLVEITRTGNGFSQRPLMGVCYGPLVRSRRLSV